MIYKYVLSVLSLLCVTQATIKNSDRGQCTTIAAAESDAGGPIISYNADCSSCDFRIAKVPAMDWPEGSMRPLYQYRMEYPAVVSEFRGPTWHPDNLVGTHDQLKAWGKSSPITGYIPQVNHTYALYEGGYGMMNEFQVSMGESTCQSMFFAASTVDGGKAMVDVRQLSSIALERTTNARDAIRLMGDIAVTYGFYSADVSRDEAGEALTVADTKEAWVFHVAPDDTGSSAIWVAQRVPFGQVAVVQNQFVIRKVDPNSDDFMFSDNLWDVAYRNNLWKPEYGLLDFVRAYSPPYEGHCCRRTWMVFHYLAPSLHLDPVTDIYGSEYPFSVTPDRGPVTRDEIKYLMRSHYEGTQFDLTKGLAAGPYGDPERWDRNTVDNMTWSELYSGSFERAIDMFRTSYSIIVEPRPEVPDYFALFWIAQYAPSRSVYVPIYVTGDAPSEATTGSLIAYTDHSAFWNFAVVGNWAARFYSHAYPVLFTNIQALESQLVNDLEQFEAKYIPIYNAHSKSVSKIQTEINNFIQAKSSGVADTFRALLPQFITQFHDGYFASDLNAQIITMNKLFYPESWLDAVGYFDNKPNLGPDVILFDSNPSSLLPTDTGLPFGAMLMTFVLSCVVSMVVTVKSIQSYKQSNLSYFLNKNSGYSVINI